MKFFHRSKKKIEKDEDFAENKKLIKLFKQWKKLVLEKEKKKDD